MKKITAILAASVACVSIAGAEELSISSTFAWESSYVFRGAQLADEYFAPSVDLSYGAFYTGIWAALPVENRVNNSTEVDLYAGYGFGLSETISMDLGATLYMYSDHAAVDPNETLEFYAGLSFEAPFSPAFYVFYDVDLKNLTLELSGGHSIEVSEEATVDVSAHLGYVELDVGGEYLYYGVGVAYGYSLAENASLSVGLNWYLADEDLMFGGDDNELTIGASFTAGF